LNAKTVQEVARALDPLPLRAQVSAIIEYDNVVVTKSFDSKRCVASYIASWNDDLFNALFRDEKKRWMTLDIDITILLELPGVLKEDQRARIYLYVARYEMSIISGSTFSLETAFSVLTSWSTSYLVRDYKVLGDFLEILFANGNTQIVESVLLQIEDESRFRDAFFFLISIQRRIPFFWEFVSRYPSLAEDDFFAQQVEFQDAETRAKIKKLVGDM